MVRNRPVLVLSLVSIAVVMLFLISLGSGGPVGFIAHTMDQDYSKFTTDIRHSFQLTREEMGHSAWVFLHTIAATYEEEPSEEQKQAAKNLIYSLTQVFPCKECRGHFTKLLAAHPPRLDTRYDFTLWLCEAHNIVNDRLGKPQFPCGKVSQAWPATLKGDCGCDDPSEEGAAFLEPDSTSTS